MTVHPPHLTVNPRDSGFYQDPYKTYAKYRKFQLIFWEHYGMWCACSFALVNRILRDRRFARTPPHGHRAPTAADASRLHLLDFDRIERHSLLNLDGAAHTRLRGHVNHAFVARQIDQLRPLILQLANECIDRFQTDRQTNLLATYATPVAARLISRMIGVPDQFVPSLLTWSHAMVRVYTMTQTRVEEDAANQAACEFSALLTTLLQQRRAEPRHDLLSHLLNAHKDSGDMALSTDELISTAVLLLNAGHEATVHQSGNAVYAILDSGLDPATLFRDTEQTSRTITEALRFDAPLHLFVRYAQTEVELPHGVRLQAGEPVALLLGAANRDPERFNHAHRFDPFRTDGGHVSLGAGAHYCVGALLARLELELTLPLLFRRLPDLRLDGVPRYRDAYHFHGLERLDVCWSIGQ